MAIQEKKSAASKAVVSDFTDLLTPTNKTKIETYAKAKAASVAADAQLKLLEDESILILQALRLKVLKTTGELPKSMKVCGLTVTFADKFSALKGDAAKAALKVIAAESKAIAKENIQALIKVSNKVEDATSWKKEVARVNEAVAEAIAAGKEPKEIVDLVLSELFEKENVVAFTAGLDQALNLLKDESREKIEDAGVKQQKPSVKLDAKK